ncbi:MAG: hypothetical protein P1U86_04335 [Verrucomicrobiales bacterium]|nr:hypothetical protein [Verrucomicrobiales bacterium]
MERVSFLYYEKSKWSHGGTPSPRCLTPGQFARQNEFQSGGGDAKRELDPAR